MGDILGITCRCEIQDKNNWKIVGITGGVPKGYIMKCVKCNAKWKEKSEYKGEVHDQQR